jgi:hypothetical protein
MASLNHNFLSERQIFFRKGLDSSGKTGGGFWRLPVVQKKTHTTLWLAADQAQHDEARGSPARCA